MNADTSLPFISILVINFSGRKWLQDCFKSLGKMGYPKGRYEIIMGDNASTDDSVDWTSKCFPWVKIIQFEKNYGFCKANNLCAKQAQGEYLLFLNNDTQVTSDFMQNLVEGILSEDKVAIGVSKILYSCFEGGTFLNSAGGIFFSSGAAVEAGWLEKDSAQYDRQQLTGFGTGAGILVQKKFFIETGGFDEYYFYGLEDVDLGFRAWLYGYKVLYVPSAVMYHYGGGTRATAKKISPLTVFLATRNNLYFMIKNFEWVTIVKGFALFHAKAVLKMGHSLLHGNLQTTRAIIKGYFFFLKDLGKTLRVRSSVQKNRKICDKDLKRQHILVGLLEEMAILRKACQNMRKRFAITGDLFDNKDSFEISKDEDGDYYFHK